MRHCLLIFFALLLQGCSSLLFYPDKHLPFTPEKVYRALKGLAPKVAWRTRAAA